MAAARIARSKSSMWLAAVALLGSAPYQCKSNDPERAREETPGEALWLLCGRFADQGDDASAKKTLDYLVERYPSSRFAERAKAERTVAKSCVGVTAEANAKAAKASAAASPATSPATSASASK